MREEIATREKRISLSDVIDFQNLESKHAICMNQVMHK